MSHLQALHQTIMRAKRHILTVAEITGLTLIALPKNPFSKDLPSKPLDIKTMINSMTNGSILRLADALSESRDHKRPWTDFVLYILDEAFEAIKQRLPKTGSFTIKEPTPGRPPLPSDLPAPTYASRLLDETRIRITELKLAPDTILITGVAETNTRRGSILIMDCPIDDLSPDDICALADYMELL